MKRYCANCISFNVCKYAEKRSPDMCRDYLFRLNPIREIMQECERQDEKWGEQNHPMTRCVGSAELIESLKYFRMINDQSDRYDWYSILQEEIGEAFTETELEKQWEEMIQAAAVVIQIIECLERRMEEKHEKNTY